MRIVDQIRVEESILRPMMALFPYPKMDSQAFAVMASEYKEALHGYSDDVLKEAWRRVRSCFSTRPPIKALTEACCRIMEEKEAADRRIREAERVKEHRRWQQELQEEGEESALNPWDARAIRARRMAREFAEQFMQCQPVAKDALLEGWAETLREYVRHSAWVQAQALLGSQGVGYDAALIAPEGAGSRLAVAAADMAARARMRGHIEVVVDGRIRRWLCGDKHRSAAASHTKTTQQQEAGV